MTDSMNLFGFKKIHGFGSKAAGFWWEWRVRINASDSMNHSTLH